MRLGMVTIIITIVEANGAALSQSLRLRRYRATTTPVPSDEQQHSERGLHRQRHKEKVPESSLYEMAQQVGPRALAVLLAQRANAIRNFRGRHRNSGNDLMDDRGHVRRLAERFGGHAVRNGGHLTERS